MRAAVSFPAPGPWYATRGGISYAAAAATVEAPLGATPVFQRGGSVLV